MAAGTGVFNSTYEVTGLGRREKASISGPSPDVSSPPTHQYSEKYFNTLTNFYHDSVTDPFTALGASMGPDTGVQHISRHQGDLKQSQF